MNKSVILPLEKNPVFTVYQLRAYELGIMQAAYESIRPWIYNKNINVQYIKKEERFTFVTYDRWSENERIMECQRLRLRQSILYSKYLDVFSLVREMLDNGYYVYCRFNEFYIPHKYSYQKRIFDHDGFIYGYDDEKEIYYATGYTADRQYGAFTFTYDEFIQGVTNLKGQNPTFDFVKPTDSFKNELNIREICDDLYDYLHSVNARPVVAEAKIFGIDCLRYFVDYINDLVVSRNSIDMRHCRLFAEMKGLMFERIEYLVNNHYLSGGTYISDYRAVKDNSIVVHHLCLKYNITKDTTILEKIVSYQNDIVNNERRILTEILSELYKYLKCKNELSKKGVYADGALSSDQV